MSPSLFGVAWHPGAVRAVAPVVAEAERRGWQNVFATSELSAGIAKRAGVRSTRVCSSATGVAVELRAMPRDTVVLAGVSEGDGVEKHVIAAARGEGFPSCAVLDNWGAYEQRLMGTMGSSALPDVLAVMNGAALQEIAAAGFFKGSLIATGHPGLDEFSSAEVARGNVAARSSLGIALDAEVIVFASQPLSQQFGRQLGYDQYEAFSMLVSAMRPDSQLIVAVHPRERSEDWADRLSAGVRIVQEYDPAVLYAAADIVASCFSAALTEAVLAGRPAISIQPSDRTRDTLWTNARGITLAAYDSAQLVAALEYARAMTPSERAHRRTLLDIPAGATVHVMQIIEGLAARACSRPY